jgi:hypothetical protein
MAARILVLGSIEADFPILMSRVRLHPETLVVTHVLTERHPEGHPLEGMLTAVDRFQGQHFDAIVYSPHVAEADELEELFRSVFEN